MSQYFENDENIKSEIKEFNYNIMNNNFCFATDNGVFSKGELDFGTFLLIKNVLKLNVSGNILDLGCGYGAIGIILSKLTNCSITMSDINKRALHLAKMNAKKNGVLANILESDGYDKINNKYNIIISNPPIRVGKEKLYSLIIDSRNYLLEDGKIYLVIRKEQGAKSFIKDMEKYYKIEILEKKKGFFVICLKLY